jgi:pyridoxal phosphate enzyme (YggS family)
VSRIDELQKNLIEIQSQIKSACETSGRNLDEITLIAVSKTWPASDIRLLHQLGVRDFGESRDQEATMKVSELADLDITWHFIGQVQTNKLNHIASYANVVHALDREKTISGLDAAAAKLDRNITGLLQISLDGDENRGGVAIENAFELAQLLSNSKNLTFGGIMAVAPIEMLPDVAFSKLAEIAAEIQSKYPTAEIISAGMSQDFESAVQKGATHLRIGSALLGNRE